MAPDELVNLVQYIVDLVGEIMTAIGGVFSAGAADAAKMTSLTSGIFGENGGLIYWCNEKLLWLLENILAGLTFTSPLGP